MAETMLQERAPELIQKCIDEALSGNGIALKLSLERLAPVLRSRPIAIELPEIRTAGDVLDAVEVIRCELADGRLSADEFESLTRGLDRIRAAIESADLQTRVERLERVAG